MGNLPSEIKVGPTTYKVRKASRDASFYGETDYMELEMAIKEMAIEQEWVTFWHEVFHTFLFVSGYHPSDHDEKLVDALANQMVDFIQKNGLKVIPIEVTPQMLEELQKPNGNS